MAKLLIEVECGSEARGDCRWLEELGDGDWYCQLFCEHLKTTRGPDIMPPRFPDCLAAEKAEAERDSLRIELAHTTERAKKPEAELARFQPLIEAAGRLNAGDMAWFDWMMETTIAEYAPRVEGGTCPGRGRKDRFRALLAAIPEAAEERGEE